MFSNNRKNQGPAVGSAAASLIARGVTLRGDILFSGALHLDGIVEGSIHADAGSDGVLTISETGRVIGRIEVPHAVINGGVTGDIDVSERLELAPLARIDGDVCYQVLEMAAGAQVNGKMVHRAPQTVRQLAQAAIAAAPALTEA
ncbi:MULTISPECIES: polymer-forming cytoskeletal protein [unclassified Luteibacter]|uniref:bactofilin family protein n=1 Tax=unclassified Luteibacter TaxID=2620188 RepID=UPI0008D3E20F|nr:MULTISPECIES: polymer-forming cytoskeletal protein [unclassified Luteibacter]MDR6937735.1 cytoskeletal protein CcmA (bactofilin family) [Luteibacter sp. 3190]SEO39923.1 protein CcmA, bactofilin family [Luteibacter sp. UNC138MFCol5.1]SEW27633.1 protein CcmA, bactofilin family [Luteibacter sp. 329MFSha]